MFLMLRRYHLLELTKMHQLNVRKSNRKRLNKHRLHRKEKKLVNLLLNANLCQNQATSPIKSPLCTGEHKENGKFLFRLIL